MDPVPQAPKNIARIRTFKDDLLRAQGNTASTPAPEQVTQPSPSKVTEPSIPATQSPLGKRDYIPLPNPQHTSSPLPQREHPESFQTGGAPLSTAPAVTYRPKQELGVKLSKEDIAKITHVQKASILSDEGRMSSDGDLGEGTIVRDKKRKRFKLLPAMVEAISNWFSDTKTEYQKAVTGEVHTVAKAESRLETIRKAIEQGRQAPKDDFSQIAAALKTTERTQIQSAILVKEKSELPEPTWSHIVGDGDVEAEQTADVEAVTQREVVVPEPVSPQVVEERIPTPVEVPVEQLQPVYAEEVQREPEVVVPYTTNAQALETPAQREAAQLPQRQYAPARTPSEKPFYIALASIVFVATMLGVGVSYYFFGGANTGVIVKDEATFETPNLFSANTTASFALPADRLTFLSALLANTEVHSEDVAHFYPTLDEADTPADVESILGVLALRADGSFVRGVREIAFGSGYGEPFIVLTTASFDAAFAGMLGWEEAMSADLAPLFGSPVSSSYNPEVRTDTGTSEAYFKDVIAVNKNARLLVDENGDDRIIYTFIDKNTVVITTTREALSEIVPLLK